ncbi:hypothetical protein [Mycoplasma suis]|nr:hypothetical protein [Mycoplasma suis]
MVLGIKSLIFPLVLGMSGVVAAGGYGISNYLSSGSELGGGQ